MGSFICKRNKALKALLGHPFVRRVYLFPLTPRKLCHGKLCQRFPKYANNSWISLANSFISKVNKTNFQFHSKLKLVQPLVGIHQHISNDGIHLTDLGKHFFFNSLFLVEEQKMLSQDDFPPLKTHFLKKSPLQSINQRIASKEEAMRNLKKTKKMVFLNAATTKSTINGKNLNFLDMSKSSFNDCSSSKVDRKARIV